jgi:SAM-dependent methyltransferase
LTAAIGAVAVRPAAPRPLDSLRRVPGNRPPRGRARPHGLRERAVTARKRIALLVPPTRLQARLRRRPLLRFVALYLEGLRGIEIGGAAHNDFGLDALNVDRYDAMNTVYKNAEREVWGYAKPVDVVASGDELPFAEASADFVFASHVIEHIPDPISALLEWQRVARRYVVLIVPHRDRTFDRERPLTPVDELLERHRTGFSSDEDRHWSVWTAETFVEMCSQVGLSVIATRDPDTKGGNGFAVVLDACAPSTAQAAA